MLSIPLTIGIVATVGVTVLVYYTIIRPVVSHYKDHITHSNSSGGDASVANGDNSKAPKGGGRDVTGLPSQGPVCGDVPGAPPVDAGSQKKHVPTHKGSIPTKTQWPVGENGVDLTQEGWQNGEIVKDTPGDQVRVWDTGRVIGANGETRVKVHQKKKTGMIHGYPVPRRE
ncbi:hypothetical protein SH2C18_15300 [Clostridium sediminicola]